MPHGIESYLSIPHVCTCQSPHRALCPGFQADVIVGIDIQKAKRRWRTDSAPKYKTQNNVGSARSVGTGMDMRSLTGLLLHLFFQRADSKPQKLLS